MLLYNADWTNFLFRSKTVPFNQVKKKKCHICFLSWLNYIALQAYNLFCLLSLYITKEYFIFTYRKSVFPFFPYLLKTAIFKAPYFLIIPATLIR